MFLCILVAIIYGTLLYGTFCPNSCYQQEIIGHQIVKLLRDENAQRALKNLQNEIFDQLRAMIGQQKKKVSYFKKHKFRYLFSPSVYFHK
jgi:hypothetical protein